MSKEIDEFSKMKNDTETNKNKYIENTMYFNIFMIIYKRIKIVRDSIKSLFTEKKKNIFVQDIFYEKKYLIKFTTIIKVLYNFLHDNPLTIFYDIHCISFLKINSLICKSFKILYNEQSFNILKKIYEENNKIIINFFTEFFFLLSKLLLIKEEEFDYKYKIAKNRKGFYFDEFKQNFEFFLKNDDFKMMIEFLDILSNDFKKICEDSDTLKPEEMDDNSIEIDSRDNCPICLEAIDEKDVHINDCNHIYHLECLKLQIKKI